MLLRRLPIPFALTFVLVTPLGVFAQRHTTSTTPVGFPSTAAAGSTFRALVGPPVVRVSNIPMDKGFTPSFLSPTASSQYPYGGFQTTYPVNRGVYVPMAGAGDSDASLRENTPEDEEILRAYRAQSASPTVPVYQPRPGADLSTSTATGLTATVVVRVPTDARVWIDDNSTRSTGPERSFETPTLTAGKTYRYDIKARWLQDGKPVDVTRSVDVRPGERSVVDFLTPNP